MEVNAAIDIAVHDGVYQPAEDTYLLIETLEVEGGSLLDMGAGTGIIGLHAALQGAEVTAVDVDARAVENTRVNAARNGMDIAVVQSDLFAAVEGRFDVMAFNPPYLPAGDGDVRWDGGREGRGVARRFLHHADRYLTENGRIYLLLSTLGDIPRLLKAFQGRYRFRRKKRLPLFFERLVVYEVTRRDTGRAPTG